MEDKIREFLKARFDGAVIKEDNFRNQQSFQIKPESLIDICRALHDDDDLKITFLSDITAVDWFDHGEQKNGRYEVVYNLYSLTHKYRFFLKIRLDGETPTVTSLTEIWNGANWMERELYDLMGITFENHPNLTKILTPDELEGHPLRKDYPLTWEQPNFNWNKDDPPEVLK